MNFYPHHIGDYLTATAHLTWLEDCAYRRLLDIYYSREDLIPLDLNQACRLVRATGKEERKAVETVLKEFFIQTQFTQAENGWFHKRCDAEILKAKALAERSKTNGMKGGRPAKQKPTPNLVGSSQETQQVISRLAKETYEEPNPKAPITNPITNISVSNDTGGKPPPPKDFVFSYGVALLVNAGTPEKNARTFLGGLCRTHGDSAVAEKLRECAASTPIEPLSWLVAALKPKPASKHSGFENLNYAEGINADGTFA